MSNITLGTIEQRRTEVSDARRRLRIYNSIAMSKKGVDLELEYELWEIGQISGWFVVFFITCSWIMLHYAYLGEYAKWGPDLKGICNKTNDTAHNDNTSLPNTKLPDLTTTISPEDAVMERIDRDEPSNLERGQTRSAKEDRLDLKCLSKDKIEKISLGMMLAGLFAGLFGGFATDLFGRVAVYRSMVPFHLVASFILALTANLTVLYICWFVMSFAVTAIMITTFTLLIDYSSLQTRCLFAMLYHSFAGLGYSVFGWILFYFSDWRVILSIWLVTELPLMFGLWFLPESARLANGNRQHALTWNLVRRINHLGLRDDVIDTYEKRTFIQKLGASFALSTATFKNCEFMKRLVCFSLTMFIVNPALAEGVAIDLHTYLDTNLQNYELTLAAIEVLTFIFLAIPFIKLGRKLASCVSFGIVAVLFLVTYFLKDSLNRNNDTITRLTLLVVGKMFLSGATTGVFIMAAETFPTTVRGTVIGILVFCQSLGYIIAKLSTITYCLDCFGLFRSGPGTIFAFAIIGILILMFVPPTRNRILVDTQEEANILAIRHKENTGFKSFIKCM